jgi:hypothetical protein
VKDIGPEVSLQCNTAGRFRRQFTSEQPSAGQLPSKSGIVMQVIFQQAFA